jgi:hypothetical protein
MADTSQSDFNNTTTKDEPIIVDDQDHDAPTAERHPRFYFEDGNVTFLVRLFICSCLSLKILPMPTSLR